MDTDSVYVGLVVAFLASRACDLQSVRAKIDLTLRGADAEKLKNAAPRVKGLFSFCSWLGREIPFISMGALWIIILTFGFAAIADEEGRPVVQQLTLATVAAAAAILVSALGAATETLRNELDRMRA